MAFRSDYLSLLPSSFLLPEPPEILSPLVSSGLCEPSGTHASFPRLPPPFWGSDPRPRFTHQYSVGVGSQGSGCSVPRASSCHGSTCARVLCVYGAGSRGAGAPGPSRPVTCLFLGRGLSFARAIHKRPRLSSVSCLAGWVSVDSDRCRPSGPGSFSVYSSLKCD